MNNEWFATFGVGSNLGRNFVRVTAPTQGDALMAIADVYGYTRTGAVRCAFVYPISDLVRQQENYHLTEVPLGTPLREYT